MSQATNTTASTDIDETTSKRICSHMNRDHAVTVYGIVTRCAASNRPCKISHAQLKQISFKGMTLSYVSCTGDICEMKTTFVPFEAPPLESAHHIRPRMIEIHNRVCAPQIHWLVTHPLALTILVVVSFMAYAVLILGVDTLAKLIQQQSPLIVNHMITSIFGSPAWFGKWVAWSLYFTVVAHGVEAIWVAYECRTTLKLQVKPTLQWFLMVLCNGYPITAEFMTLRKVHLDAKKATKKL